MIMAKKQHMRFVLMFLMALVLIFPPLTSIAADALGIELAHHHCDSHAGDGANPEHEDDAMQSHGHSAAESDPFQCEQCHVALAALTVEPDLALRADINLLLDFLALALLPVQGPRSFKPPIA